MPRLGSTLSGLVTAQRNWGKLMRLAEGVAGSATAAAETPPSRLGPVADFGSNPGALDMFVHAPRKLAPKPALVVVLHGCTQNAAGYDHGSGWSTLADRHGFVLVYAQQRQANNAKGCFDWFQPADIARDGGEAMSIRQMVERAVRDHGVDRSRIFVTGLSAGGAMAAVMLATYPDVFAGGAVIAGLPYGGARTVSDALSSMFQGRSHEARQWGDLVRAASDHRGPWPTLSIWHGSADATVKPDNAHQLAKQWTDLHGLSIEGAQHDTIGHHERLVWRDKTGRPVVESVTIAGMGHGTPLHAGTGPDQAGVAGPFMLDVGVSSSHEIARFWGLADVVVKQPASRRSAAAALEAQSNSTPRPVRRASPSGSTAAPIFDIANTINTALKSAGLLKN